MKTIIHDGRTFRVEVERDDCMSEPWKEHDGHGPVSEWTSRDKRPGERVLAEDHGSKRYYDFAEAVKIAKRDGWDAEPYGGKPGKRAVRAAEADFRHLRAWCRDEWEWLMVRVVLLDANGAETECQQSCGGIDGDGPYVDELARELASQIAIEADHEATERAHWAARGVETRA